MSTVKKTPQRQCIGCREMKNKKDMIRILKTPEGGFIIDSTGKKNGRGAYICPKEECLEKAISGKGLERSFKMVIPQEVYDGLKKELKNIAAE